MNVRSIAVRGAWKAYDLVKALWSLGNDLVLGIRTMPGGLSVAPVEPAGLFDPGQDVPRSRFGDAGRYESPDYWNLRKVIAKLSPSGHDVVYDLGSGKGRVLCLFARHPVERCVGIELYEPLCEIARSNARRLRGRKAPIDIVCGDAADAPLDDGTIYFMFNPFGPETMTAVVDRIVASLKPQPRKITIVYHNERHEGVLASCDALHKRDTLRTISGVSIGFWTNEV